jgi:hypothetical protein
VIKAFLNSVACCISFFPEYLDYFAPAMFGILALQGLLYATQVLVLLNRLLYPRNRSDGKEDGANVPELSSGDIELTAQSPPLVAVTIGDAEGSGVDDTSDIHVSIESNSEIEGLADAPNVRRAINFEQYAASPPHHHRSAVEDLSYAWL